MIFDQARNLLVYPPEQAFRAASACLDHRWLPDRRVAARATLTNLQRLRAQGLPIPQPMQDYDWPCPRHVKAPMQAQVVTANFLVSTPHAFVLSDMGTGKTLAALWAADYLMRQHEPGTFRCLIVTTLSTMSSVWGDAIFQSFMGRRTSCVLSGSAERRRSRLASKADFSIVNHDGVGIGATIEPRKPYTGLAADIAARSDIQLVIIDEASVYRDATTRRSRVARNLLGSRPYLWAMTGTPTPNGPTDAYGLAKLVVGTSESFRSFQDRVTVPIGPFKRVPRPGANAIAHQTLQPAVRFKIKDCVDLPPCTVQRRDVALSSEQKEAYADLKRDCQLAVKGGKITAINEGVLRLKLIQVACGAVYDGDRQSHLIDAGPRLAELDDVIEQCPHKLIVFAPLTNVLNLLKSHLKARTPALINGSVPQGERTDIFRRFQDPKDPLRLIVADPGTMAHGLTLTEASTIVWYGPTDRTETYLQANKRIDRPGQKNHTSIVQFVSTPIEKEIFDRLEKNESMQGLILKLAEG